MDSPSADAFQKYLPTAGRSFFDLEKGGDRKDEWWDLDLTVERINVKTNWSEDVLATFDRVVKMEMISDVPLGSFLSGGIDSSSIVALMTNHAGKKVSTYTSGIWAEDLRFDIIPDDVEWAQKVGKLPIDYHEILLTPDVAELLPILVYHSDAPIVDTPISTYLISKAVAKTHKVLLSGVGGDEIFAGYPRQLAMQIAGITDFVP